jgi:hypothetical protein
MNLGPLLAAASIAQVISNATAWIVGILAGVATLFLTVGVTAVPATDWFAVARWAKETHNLQPWQRQIAFTIGQYLSKSWDISARQAAQAARLMEEARRLGFRSFG